MFQQIDGYGWNIRVDMLYVQTNEQWSGEERGERQKVRQDGGWGQIMGCPVKHGELIHSDSGISDMN